jgi:hypothetical protein
MTGPRIGLGDPQRCHWTTAENRYRIHRLAAGHAGKPPSRAGTEVSGALRHHSNLGA